MALQSLRLLQRKSCILQNAIAPCLIHSSVPMKNLSAQEEMKNFWIKNETLKRPQSPHLSIYKLGISGYPSIVHRITGVALAGALYGTGWAALASPYGPWPDMKITDYVDSLVSLGGGAGSAGLFLIKLAICWPMCYHFINGLRHLAWDTGRGFDMPTLTKTAYTAMALSAVISIALCTIKLT